MSVPRQRKLAKRRQIPASRQGSALGLEQARQHKWEGGLRGAGDPSVWVWGHLQMILGGLQGVQALPGWLHLSPRTLEVRMHHFLPGCQLGRSKWQVVLNPKCSTNSRKSRAGGN